ncbi:hypothetical protein ABVV53_06595 [Novosphingobium sp. RD2P27]|uniref:Uncharacterized protein n=1 Tax=Novosphingobium kalidii TaxID=3230299 RepID=A0ABV2CZT6_9SPHN
MVKPPDPRSREERLAAKLRENLHRRKAQARAMGALQDIGGQSGEPENDSEIESGTLSNEARES